MEKRYTQDKTYTERGQKQRGERGHIEEKTSTYTESREGIHTERGDTQRGDTHVEETKQVGDYTERRLHGKETI